MGNTLPMTYTIIVRSIIIYCIVLFLLRIMGKRQLGEMQPYEFVITMIIADLATIPMSDTALPLLHGIIPICTLALLHFFFSFISRKSTLFRKILNGKPIIVITPDGIDYTALQLLNMTFNDLMESLRTAGYFHLEEVLYAIMQTNGSLSVMPRAMYAPLTPEDMSIQKEQATLPIIILAEGKLEKNNLAMAKLTEKNVTGQLKQFGFGNLKDLILVTLDQQGTLYIKPRVGKFVTKKLDYDGKDNW